MAEHVQVAAHGLVAPAEVPHVEHDAQGVDLEEAHVDPVPETRGRHSRPGTPSSPCRLEDRDALHVVGHREQRRRPAAERRCSRPRASVARCPGRARPGRRRRRRWPAAQRRERRRSTDLAGPGARRVEHDQVGVVDLAQPRSQQPRSTSAAPHARPGAGRRGCARASATARASDSTASTLPVGPDRVGQRRARTGPTPAYRSSARSPGCGRERRPARRRRTSSAAPGCTCQKPPRGDPELGRDQLARVDALRRTSPAAGLAVPAPGRTGDRRGRSRRRRRRRPRRRPASARVEHTGRPTTALGRR